MLNLKYINNQNESVDLTEYLVVTDASALFGRSWNAETLSTSNKIVGFSKKNQNFSIKLCVYGDDAEEKLTSILNIFEKDIVINKKGKLICNGWTIEGNIQQSTTNTYLKTANMVNMTVKFITDSYFWNKEQLYVHRIYDIEPGATNRGLGYEYDYPYDFLSPISSETLSNDGFTDTPFKIVVYGPVVNPSIAIGGHVYQVFTVVEQNEYLVIDGQNKTITRVTRRGEKINEFARRNKQSYIFQKIPAGDNPVVILPECNVDIVLLKERSEPEWKI